MSNLLETPSAPRRIPALPRPRVAGSPLWRALAPGGVIFVASAAVMVMVWCLGVAFDLRRGGGLRAEDVLADTMPAATVERLRARAKAFTRRADEAEARALSAAPDAAALEGHRKSADLYAEWAARLETRVAGREIVLATRESRRILWIYSISLDLLVCVGAALIGLAITLRALGVLRRENAAPRHFAGWVLAGQALLALAGYWLLVTVWYDYETEPFLLVREALDQGVFGLVRFDDGLHVGTTVLEVVACVLVVATPRLLAARAPDGAESAEAAFTRQAREIADSMRVLRLVLYVGAAMVVAYVVAMNSVFHWTLAYVDPASQALLESVQSLTRSAVTARSLLASALLAAVYGPAAFTLRLMAADLAARALPDASLPAREEWMKEQGLASTNSLQHLRTLAAILAPLVTGPIADLLQGALG